MLKSQCLQGVAGEDRGGFVELHVVGRAATTQFIIIHRRQIIVNQRISVNHLSAQAVRINCSLVAPKVWPTASNNAGGSACRRQNAPANRRVHARWFVRLAGD